MCVYTVFLTIVIYKHSLHSLFKTLQTNSVRLKQFKRYEKWILNGNLTISWRNTHLLATPKKMNMPYAPWGPRHPGEPPKHAA